MSYISTHLGNLTIFSTSGFNTWTCPNNVNYINLILIGGGGGGGGGGSGGAGFFSTANSITRVGGGGGGAGSSGSSGNYIKIDSLSVTPGKTYSIVVGAGGNGGTGGAATSRGNIGNVDGYNGNAGTAGGNSYFYLNGNIGYYAQGGNGGAAGNGGKSSTSAGGTSSNQAGAAGATTTGASTSQVYFPSSPLLNSSSLQEGLYSIYTSANTPPINTSNPAVGSTTIVNNGLYNTSSNTGTYGTSYAGAFHQGSVFVSGPNNTYNGGGAGGILTQTSLIPIYFIGVDISSYANLPIPGFITTNGTGLGSGGTYSVNNENGYSANSSSAIFWRTGGVSKIGYGAGGLGGPGGGGGAGTSTAGNGNGGAGYQGDVGLNGAVLIYY